MLIQFILGLLSEAPIVLADIEKALTEIKSKDPTGQKVGKIASDAAAIATVAANVTNPPAGG